MGNQQQPWTFAEDRFGRRMRTEREQRGMTQAEVARILESDHGLKIHATAIAKMEQRDVPRPRVIRLSEAQAVASLFGLTVDEMMSDAAVEMEAIAREFTQLGNQAEALRTQTGYLIDRVRKYLPLIAAPSENVTPAIVASRKKIRQTMEELERIEEERRNRSQTLLEETWLEEGRQLELQGVPISPNNIKAQRRQALRVFWCLLAHRSYGLRLYDIMDSVSEHGNELNIKIASHLQPPGTSKATWLLVAVLSHGLWGRSAEEEYRFRNTPDRSPEDVTSEMIEEIQTEWISRLPDIGGISSEMETRWGSSEELAAWSKAGIDETRLHLRGQS